VKFRGLLDERMGFEGGFHEDQMTSIAQVVAFLQRFAGKPKHRLRAMWKGLVDAERLAG
jgi:hypothetical protein